MASHFFKSANQIFCVEQKLCAGEDRRFNSQQLINDVFFWSDCPLSKIFSKKDVKFSVFTRKT